MAILLAALAGTFRSAAADEPHRFQRGRFTVVAYPTEARLARTLLERATALDTFPGMPRTESPVLILLAPDRATFREWIGPAVPEWGSAVAFPGQGRIVLQGRSAGSDAGDPAVTLRHELAHLALFDMLGRRVPRWFDEGYASFAAGEWGREEILATSLALLVRGPPSLDELDDWFVEGTTRARTAYALSHRAVAELSALDPERGLSLFLRYWNETGSMDVALRQAYGLTLAGFDAHWRRRTHLRYGALAAVGNLTLALGAMAILVLPLYLLRRRRDRRKLDAMRAEEAASQQPMVLDELLRANSAGGADDSDAAEIPDRAERLDGAPRDAGSAEAEEVPSRPRGPGSGEMA